MNDNQQKPPVGFDHTQIEKKWQEKWEKEGVYKTADRTDKPKYYVLDMFPYPSGTGLHVGHPRGYIASDIFSRFKRMQGFNVLHPMGFDSFGLPAEQYAIKTGNHPGPHTDELVEHYKKQLSNIGFSYDWSREVATHKPEYYKWTQWIFLQLYNSWYNTATNKTESIETCIEKLSKEDSSWNTYSEKEKQDILMKYRIAYEGYAEVNWCPELGTVLANDEVVTAPDGSMVSERGEHPVIRKSMRQWFMRISAYADRLLAGLDTIDWPHSIKEIQRNWIGKSEGSEITFYIENKEFGYYINNVDIFTTRADTLYGVTYLALAVDHPLVETLLKKEITNWDAVYAYIQKVKQEDTINIKEITGIKLEGVVAKQSFMEDFEVPVYLTNYVVGTYGTGAVMAVPAHDERDFEFAKKYELPIKYAVFPKSEDVGGVGAIIQTIDNKYIFQKRTKAQSEPEKICTFGGGKNDNENIYECLFRELEEELEFKKEKLNEVIPASIYIQNGVPHVFFFITQVDESKLILHEGESIVSFDSLEDFINHPDASDKQKEVVKNYLYKKHFTEYGTVVGCDTFNNLSSEEAKKKITEFVGGRLVTKYKMRDAIFARQRYWGEPIPLRHTGDGMISALTEKELPLMLPEIEDFAPAGDGNSALSKSKEWMEKGYETNTMPGWAGSSWYFLRYMDPKNSQRFASAETVNYWGQVDMYVGGAEHATGHLLYSRFWNIALHDLGYVPFAEPFAALRNQGMIAGPDGRKMSKRWGNVINPDDVVARLGADTLRVYESFMGPFESHLPWSTDAIAGSRRFVERVYRLIENGKIGESTDATLEKVLHKTIKKVTDDIQTFSFNTAVSAMMILLNEIEKSESISHTDMKSFLKLLAPFAPHITEELWSSLGEAESIHLAPWPMYDESKTVDAEVTIAIQINGKVRGSLVVGRDENEESIKEKAFALPQIAKYLEGQEIKKVVYIAGKIISVVL